jgi:hypothetical protein
MNDELKLSVSHVERKPKQRTPFARTAERALNMEVQHRAEIFLSPFYVDGERRRVRDCRLGADGSADGEEAT